MPATTNASSPSLPVILAIALIGVGSLLIAGKGQVSGAITMPDQALYEMGLSAYDKCDPQINPFVENPRQRAGCCAQTCFAPCISSGIPDCDQGCKIVCLGRPIYSPGGTP